MDTDKLFTEFVALTKAHGAKPFLALGTSTSWGEVAGIRFCDGERFYFLVDALGEVAMMPADVVEAA